jgi:hypothetical protein
MRNGQHQHQHHKRMRGRGSQQNNRRNQNPLTRVYESNGPDVKIRGTANHVAEKYLQLARDAQSSGDPIAAENYFQHAEHYFRLIAAAQEQFRQNNPNFQPRPDGGGNEQQFPPRNDSLDDGEDEQPFAEAPFGAREPQPYVPREQPYLPRDAQPFVPRDNQNYQPREATHEARPHERPQPRIETEGGQALPAFITGSAPQPAPPQTHGQNGYENQADRFPLHRRRRRHRGPRNDMQGGPPQGSDRPDDSGG